MKRMPIEQLSRWFDLLRDHRLTPAQITMLYDYLASHPEAALWWDEALARDSQIAQDLSQLDRYRLSDAARERIRVRLHQEQWRGQIMRLTLLPALLVLLVAGASLAPYFRSLITGAPEPRATTSITVLPLTDTPSSATTMVVLPSTALPTLFSTAISTPSSTALPTLSWTAMPTPSLTNTPLPATNTVVLPPTALPTAPLTATPQPSLTNTPLPATNTTVLSPTALPTRPGTPLPTAPLTATPQPSLTNTPLPATNTTVLPPTALPTSSLTATPQATLTDTPTLPASLQDDPLPSETPLQDYTPVATPCQSGCDSTSPTTVVTIDSREGTATSTPSPTTSDMGETPTSTILPSP